MVLLLGLLMIRYVLEPLSVGVGGSRVWARLFRFRGASEADGDLRAVKKLVMGDNHFCSCL